MNSLDEIKKYSYKLTLWSRVKLCFGVVFFFLPLYWLGPSMYVTMVSSTDMDKVIKAAFFLATFGIATGYCILLLLGYFVFDHVIIVGKDFIEIPVNTLSRKKIKIREEMIYSVDHNVIETRFAKGEAILIHIKDRYSKKRDTKYSLKSAYLNWRDFNSILWALKAMDERNFSKL